MKPVASLVRFELSFFKQTSHMAGADALNNALIAHLLSEDFGTPVTDGALVFCRRVTGHRVELGDLLQANLAGVPERAAS